MFFKLKNRKRASAFGCQTPFEKSELVIICAPWEVTASYNGGTSTGPEKIRKASSQLDFFHKASLKKYNHFIHFKKSPQPIKKLNKKASKLAKKIQNQWEEDKTLNTKEKQIAQKINSFCKQMMDFIYQETKEIFSQNKIPALVGGDHSVSEGILKAVGEKYQGDYGLLHIDAHHDLRNTYQGFKHSHASVMYNVIQEVYAPKKILQLGIRDFCEQEYELAKKDSRISCYYDEDISKRLFSGETWKALSEEIVQQLPEKIYISLDVDGLSWEYAPGTGTPVPGGLSFNQLQFLLQEIKKQNKKIIGFDVVETSGDEKLYGEWNGNVSARLVYQMACLALDKN